MRYPIIKDYRVSGRGWCRYFVPRSADRFGHCPVTDKTLNCNPPRVEITGNGRCRIDCLDRSLDGCGALSAFHIGNIEAFHHRLLNFSNRWVFPVLEGQGQKSF